MKGGSLAPGGLPTPETGEHRWPNRMQCSIPWCYGISVALIAVWAEAAAEQIHDVCWRRQRQNKFMTTLLDAWVFQLGCLLKWRKESIFSCFLNLFGKKDAR